MRTGTSFWNILAVASFIALTGCGKSDPAAQPPQKDPVQAPALAPTFESLSANIFQPKCAGCHKTGPEAPVHSDSGVNVFFESQDQLLQAGVIVPGEPDQSELYKRVTESADVDGHMPDDGGVLSAAELDAIRSWIAGMGSNGVILTPVGN